MLSLRAFTAESGTRQAVVYIGEPRGHCCGNVGMWDLLCQEWHLVSTVDLTPRLPLAYSQIMVFTQTDRVCSGMGWPTRHSTNIPIHHCTSTSCHFICHPAMSYPAPISRSNPLALLLWIDQMSRMTLARSAARLVRRLDRVCPRDPILICAGWSGRSQV